jgi:hypothetical protein
VLKKYKNVFINELFQKLPSIEEVDCKIKKILRGSHPITILVESKIVHRIKKVVEWLVSKGYVRPRKSL